MARRVSKRRSRPRRRKSREESEAKSESARGHEHQSCPIAATGASAGGLEAFEKFLGRMPVEKGMAFVMVPHLDARHRSAMIELLQRCTPMRVVEITDGMRPEPDGVHVIPPNGTLTIEEGTLRIATP